MSFNLGNSKNIKCNKCIISGIIGIIIGGIIFRTVGTMAITLSAEQISYNPENSGFGVNNSKAALDKLYDMADRLSYEQNSLFKLNSKEGISAGEYNLNSGSTYILAIASTPSSTPSVSSTNCKITQGTSKMIRSSWSVLYHYIITDVKDGAKVNFSNVSGDSGSAGTANSLIEVIPLRDNFKYNVISDISVGVTSFTKNHVYVMLLGSHSNSSNSVGVYDVVNCNAGAHYFLGNWSGVWGYRTIFVTDIYDNASAYINYTSNEYGEARPNVVYDFYYE